MPLGASITYGEQSSTGNGYRNDLHNLLTDSGYTVNMVGSRKHGSMKDNDVEGWPGFRIKQVQSKAQASVPSRLPNVFTVNAGTNDCAQNKQEGAGQRTDDLLEYLWKASPDSTIILSTLLINLNSTIEARVEKVNNQIREVAKQKASQKKRIVLVDMHANDGPQKGDMAPDGTHPRDAGYSKMAKIWFRGVQEAANKGFLKKPKPLPGN